MLPTDGEIIDLRRELWKVAEKKQKEFDDRYQQVFTVTEAKSSVYILRCNEYYKIGVSENPKKRLSTIQIGNPYKVILLVSVEMKDAYGAEQELHTVFKHKRVQGEWFELDEQDLEKLAKMLITYQAYTNEPH